MTILSLFMLLYIYEDYFNFKFSHINCFTTINLSANSLDLSLTLIVSTGSLNRRRRPPLDCDDAPIDIERYYDERFIIFTLCYIYDFISLYFLMSLYFDTLIIIHKITMLPG